MKRSMVCALFVTLICGLPTAHAEEHYDVLVERGVTAKMRDAVILRADIYRPKAAGKFPVLLARTPYDKRQYYTDFGTMAAARGYIVIVQDVRGRYTSDGEWYPFKYESMDGYDTVEWAAALPSSNGKVGMYGGSYVGATQMLAAIADPPHLAGILPMITASNYHENWTYQGGAFAQWFDQSWATGLAMDTLNRRVRRDSNAARWQKILPLVRYPLLDPGARAGIADYYVDWLAHPDYDDYWKQWSIEEKYSHIRVPALHVTGWYDPFQDGPMRSYVGIKALGGSDAARKGQRLLVIVGGHAGPGPKIGEVDFGKDSVLDEPALFLRWYDYLLKGVNNGMAGEKPVKLFVMGKNVWREEESWPLARARETRYYLHSAGKANTLRGDGLLDPHEPLSETPDEYTYDPADPVPSRGGPCCNSIRQPSGALDQRPVENRDDVLVYTTPAFQRDTEVTGPITLEVYASSSAVDTDFTGKVVDVGPQGFAQNLTEGILRGRYRASREKVELMNPGQVYKLTVNLSLTSNVFLAGHRLRLEISSSNFPRFDRNLNTGEDQGHSTRMVKATNIIYHDPEHPSALILPVVSP